MTESPDIHRGPDDPMEDDTATPRWVKAFGAVALLLFVVFVVAHLAGGFGSHLRR